MQFSEESLDQFIEIYEHKFNEPITREDASAMAHRLVTLYRILLRPLPPEVLKEMQEEEVNAEEAQDPSE